MRNGLYKADFQTQRGSGHGVVVIADGKITGGDSMMYYVGTYTETNNQFTAQLNVDRHSNIAGMQPVFGVNRVNITLTGTVSGDKITTTGQAKEAPGVSFSALLTRLSD